MKGFVVIEVSGGSAGGKLFQPRPLDVVPVYTAHGFSTDSTGVTSAEGFAFDVERVTPTRR